MARALLLRMVRILGSVCLCTLLMVELTGYSQSGYELVGGDTTEHSLTRRQQVEEGGGVNSSKSQISPDGRDKDKEDTSWSYLLIHSADGQLFRVGLISSREYRDLPFEVMFGRLEVVSPPPGNATVTINHRPTRTMNYTFGLGVNYIDIGVVSPLSQRSAAPSTSHYLVHVNRLPRPAKHTPSPGTTCYLEQDCSLRVYDDIATCGVVARGHNSTSLSRGHWRLSCGSCEDEETCEWDSADWIPSGAAAAARWLADSKLKECLGHKQLLFLGDSTNRGLMQSLMERVNGSLTAAEKSHARLGYSGLGDGTDFSFTYYPAFWLEKWPTFVQALQDLLGRKEDGGKSARDTYLVVGGVQWLTKGQLQEVVAFTRRFGIPAENVIVKTHSSGFLHNVDGVPYTHTKESLKRVIKQNDDLVKMSKQKGFSVVDTLQMTLSRYKEFLQGKCACHFHEVNEYEGDGARQSQTLVSKLYKMGLVERKTGSPNLYHISGSIHNAYTAGLVQRLCGREG